MPSAKIELSGDGSVALVTAGASGIGRCIAETLQANDSRIHVCDVDEAAINLLLADHPSMTASVADVSSVTDVDRLFDDIEQRYGRLDILVNNAGVAGPTAEVENVDPADWDRTIAVDLNSAFYCARKAVPYLKESAGCIINMSSTAGLRGFAARAPYVAAKWGIIGLTKTLAIELGEYGVRVNAVCPGSVEGERIDGVIAREANRQGVSKDEIRKSFESQASLRRFLSPEDVANMVLYLTSASGNGISGQAIRVDGHTE